MRWTQELWSYLGYFGAFIFYTAIIYGVIAFVLVFLGTLYSGGQLVNALASGMTFILIVNIPAILLASISAILNSLLLGFTRVLHYKSKKFIRVLTTIGIFVICYIIGIFFYIPQTTVYPEEFTTLILLPIIPITIAASLLSLANYFAVKQLFHFMPERKKKHS